MSALFVQGLPGGLGCLCVHGAADVCPRVDHNPELGLLHCDNCGRENRASDIRRLKPKRCRCGSEYGRFHHVDRHLQIQLAYAA